jgi:hypothetical protein
MPSITNNTSGIYASELLYEKNGKSPNAIIDNLLPNPLDFNDATKWTVLTGPITTTGSNTLEIDAGALGQIAHSREIPNGSCYRVTISVHQDVSHSTSLSIGLSTLGISPIHTETINQGDNVFSFVFFKDSTVAESDNFIITIGGTSQPVDFKFNALKLSKQPTTRVLQRGSGEDTFKLPKEGIKVWKIKSLANVGLRGGSSSTNIFRSLKYK